MAKGRKPKPKKKRRKGKVGAPPGTIEASADAHPTQLRWMRFDPDTLEEGEGMPPDDDGRCTWLDVVGLADVELVQAVGQRYGLHALALEDVVHTHQRPKVEHFGEQVFVVVKMLSLAESVDVEQVSLFVVGDTLISFQERPGDCFDPVRARIRGGRKQIRQGGAAYLCYALLDALIDVLFPVLEQLGDRLERVEDAIFEDPEETLVEEVHAVKRDLVTIRRATWPLRELVSSLLRGEGPMSTEALSPYLRDCYDHAVQLVDLVETQRDHASSLIDVYLSTLGHRQNEVMKVLTLVSSIFIPLGFLAGLYGMNFDTGSPYNLPELGYRYGYPILLSVMASLIVGMLLFFRKKRWL